MPPAFPRKVILFRYIAGGILSLPYESTGCQHTTPPGGLNRSGGKFYLTFTFCE